MKIFYWSPFISKVATVSTVIRSAESILKYSKKEYYFFAVVYYFGPESAGFRLFFRPNAFRVPLDAIPSRSRRVGWNLGKKLPKKKIWPKTPPMKVDMRGLKMQGRNYAKYSGPCGASPEFRT